MGSIYARWNKLWARYKDEHGKWVSAPTPYHVGQEARAQKYVAKLEQLGKATAETAAEVGGPVTVARYAAKWLEQRRKLGIKCVGDDEIRLRLHVLPRIGELLLSELRPRHMRDLVLQLRQEGKLAPRTIHMVYHLAGGMLRNAAADELLDGSPWLIPTGTLPKKVDKDPTWRAGAIYTREEVEQLISDQRIPEDRRVLYALKALAGMRHGEAAELRWRQYDRTLEPLGGISLERTKTQVPRRIPVHPTLAAMLAEWHLSGWERVYGRAPTPDDLVVPTRNMTARDKHEAPKALRLDLDTLGLRQRRGHDLRRTFITLAQVDGAARHILETISHGPRGDIVSVYTTFPWPALCAEVAKLRIERRESKLLTGAFATGLATGERKARNRWRKFVTPPRVELGISP